ncbi:acetylornithine transaminase [Fimbriimonas ginsengisoli]|uniref:Acetylornithine aminotransferase n=1 Tax=Fimbriimonas ginsengisoli Gsoil 348 TaxID=661478 RepID=A0A068NTF5_FIMGI|nr:acetylornithine transaminase [Fimbriimonas ginsengisoli]AIE84899.1 ornithine carbamoyltransferase [Fimbriimonas ginsengisoli Gsoil 348]
MLKYDSIKTADDEFVLHTYNRMPALFVQGAGCSLWDNRGNEYLDMLAGIAVCQLGHCHPAVVAAITRQAQQLIHTSNLLLTAPQAQLAKRLTEISGMERVFFANDGATANEAALKIAKKHGNKKRPDGDYQIITLHRSFHGRTMGALSATGQRKYQRPFEPLVPGFVHVTADDLQELRDAFSHKTAAVLLEPIMGEGGILDLSTEYLQEAERLCREHDALLILDEVQCGMGRSGKWFTFQHHGVRPDVLILAKGLGGGLPIGAVVVAQKATSVLEPGDHGTTFGGNPLVCAAALAVIDTLDHQDLLENAERVGGFLRDALAKLPGVVEVRGKGLMLGAVLDKPVARDIVRACFDRKLIINATDELNLRFVPPLIVTEEQIAKAIGILAEAMGVETPALTPISTRTSTAVKPAHDFLSIDDMTDGQLEEVLDLAAYSKQRRALAPSVIQAVEGRTVAMVFEKQSLRTRVSFETAIRELGGHPLHLGKDSIAMGQREPIKDVASNLSRWCSLIVARLYWQRDIVELAEHATVPVVNALTEWEHPCQALADMQTIREVFGQDKVKITYVGDGNNVARSLAKLATRLGYPFTICGPENFRLEPIEGVRQTTNLEEGVAGAHVVYTDVWVSMGDEHEQEHRLKVFEPYQVNGRLMSMAEKDAIFLHCLPARRGFEVTADVIDGPQSRTDDQAENRLHAQKALLQKIMGL